MPDEAPEAPPSDEPVVESGKDTPEKGDGSSPSVPQLGPDDIKSVVRDAIKEAKEELVEKPEPEEEGKDEDENWVPKSYKELKDRTKKEAKEELKAELEADEKRVTETAQKINQTWDKQISDLKKQGKEFDSADLFKLMTEYSIWDLPKAFQLFEKINSAQAKPVVDKKEKSRVIGGRSNPSGAPSGKKSYYRPGDSVSDVASRLIADLRQEEEQ